MDRLSSCYFCGGAVDVSLSEYPIIPKSLDPEAEKQGKVVLCSTCRKKLATIVEPAVEAAKADAREAAETVAGTGATEPPGGLDDGTPMDDDPTTTENVVEPADDGSLLGDDSASATEREPSEQSAATAGSTPETGATETAAADASDKRAAESAGESENSADNDDSPSLTKLEYNKVMRLLKNREMPVDRAEIREVAINAYDIDGERFDAVIDAAVGRDLLGQENGRLVRTD